MIAGKFNYVGCQPITGDMPGPRGAQNLIVATDYVRGRSGREPIQCKRQRPGVEGLRSKTVKCRNGSGRFTVRVEQCARKLAVCPFLS